MFGPWIEIYVWFKGLLPVFHRHDRKTGKKKWLRIPKLNFITLHYIYLISLTIIGSIILYPAGNLDYIDALFFGSGCATQSGLNTVNLSHLELYQQIFIMILGTMATPIFINTFVVFVRLYWFEKRFQNVVLEAQKYRRTRERSRSIAEGKEGHDVAKEEMQLGRRKIVVMHPGDRTMSAVEHHGETIMKHLNHQPSSEFSSRDGLDVQESSSSNAQGDASPKEIDEQGIQSTDKDAHDKGVDPNQLEQDEQRTDDEVHNQCAQPNENEDSNQEEESTPSEEQGHEKDHKDTNFHREITFADEIKTPAGLEDDGEERLPSPRPTTHHIAFVENQRNPKDTGTLYIPGPRDFDRGYRPQEVKFSNRGLTRAISDIDSPITPHSPALKPTDEEESTTANGEVSLRKRAAKKISLDEAALAITKAGTRIASKVKFPYHGADGTKDVDGNKDEVAEEEEEDEDIDSPASLHRRGRSRTFASFRSAITQEASEVNSMPYLSYQATMGRNSAFVNLSEEQREELGGIEYRALKTLALILCVYYIGFHLLGVVCLAPWIVYDNTYGTIVNNDGASRAWWGFFTSASLFNDLGYTLTPNSMISFKYAVFPLLLGSWLIIIGNTGFPCWLRLMIWVTSKFVPKNSSIWEELRFLLDHPRRCFTLLFPSKATWWLFWVLVILNGLDLLFFIVLDLHDSVVSLLPAGIRVLDGWFQAASTRTAGFAIVNLSNLHPGCQVSYLIMMYISVFPIAISVRRTNVYEERSLGIWASEDNEAEDEEQSYVGTHLRRQLSFDLWYIFLGMFIICIAEGDKIQNVNDYAFTSFSVLFEIVSAYGTVGLSLGYPGTETSFSAQFGVISKLVIIAMQIRGRHRGLPYALDKAILLPSEEQQRKENQGFHRRRTEERRSYDQGHYNDEPQLHRVGTERSTKSNVSARSQRRGNWKQLLGSALSAGPAAKRMD